MATTSINQKCMAPRLPGSSYKYKAILVTLVPAKYPEKRYEHAAGDKESLVYTVDAIVCLQEMDRGRLIQVPLFDVQIVDVWPTEE